MYAPELLDGDGIVEETTGERVSRDRLRRAAEEYRGAIPLIQAVEEKQITLTLEEHLRQPAAFVHARYAYRRTIAEIRDRK